MPGDLSVGIRRAIGNQALGRMFPPVRAKNEIGETDDPPDPPSLALQPIAPPREMQVPSSGDRSENDADETTDDISALPAAQSVPPAIQAALTEHARPLDTAARHALAPRFGGNPPLAWIHTGPAAEQSATDLGAKAFTWFNHIAFGRGQYNPATHRGQSLIAHELAHVGQQTSGDAGSESAQEQQASQAEAGATLAGFQPGVPKPSLRLRSGDAVDLNISVNPTGSATFEVQLEGGGTRTATGSVTALDPGEYTVEASTVGVMVIRGPDGATVPTTHRFDIPPTTRNSAASIALRRALSPIPMHVSGVANSPQPPRAEGDPEPDANQQREEVNRMPERIRNFLFSQDKTARRTRPEEYAALLRIAHAIENLSDFELEEFRARSAGEAYDVDTFEASVNRWLIDLQQRHTSEKDLDNATAALFGMDQIYEMYRAWGHGLLMGGPPSWIADWEALPVSQLPTDREGDMNLLYLRLRRALAPWGYANLAAFSTAIQNFIDAFRENAFHIGLDLLDRYEHTLTTERKRYLGGASADLFTSLAPARATYKDADAFKDQAQSGGWGPSDVENSYAAGPEYQRRIAVGRGQVTSLAGQHPLLANQDFSPDDLGRAATEPAAQKVMLDYIRDGIEHVHDTRERLTGNHDLVFRLNVLVSQTMARQGIASGSIWAKIIEDKDAPTVDDTFLQFAGFIFIAALAIASGGSALAAIATLGISSYMALQTYEDYAVRKDAYGAQLLSEEPSLAWVVLSIVAVVADMGAVAKVIGPIRPALKAFQETGDVAALETQLSGVEERIRRSILARAQLEAKAIKGWQSIVPPGTARASVFGADILIDWAGRIAYSIQLNLRRGINTFNRWVLTREAVSLIGDIANLGPAEVKILRAAYEAGVADAQRIATVGRRLGMSEDAVDAAMQAWARRGSGTVEDVLHDLEQASVGTYPTTIRWGVQEVPARPHPAIEGSFWGRRTPQPNPRVNAYELKINPNNESFFLPHPQGGYVQFENLTGSVVQDGKLVMAPRSLYHVADLPPFATTKVLAEARRQLAAAGQAGLQVEWLVSDATALQQLQDLFQREGIGITLRLLAE